MAATPCFGTGPWLGEAAVSPPRNARILAAAHGAPELLPAPAWVGADPEAGAAAAIEGRTAAP